MRAMEDDDIQLRQEFYAEHTEVMDRLARRHVKALLLDIYKDLRALNEWVDSIPNEKALKDGHHTEGEQ